jgi:hypothetical protein
MSNIQVESFNELFDNVVSAYHIHNDIFFSIDNPYKTGSLEYLLFEKCLIDTRQWHMEDEVRNPAITASKGMEWKRLIDKSNQQRTDIVERIDDYFFQQFNSKIPSQSGKMNTESPAWAIDRLSILAIKIYHMREETKRTDADKIHIARCIQKLELLLQQRTDLTQAIDELLDDYRTGKKYMKVYRQVKMYNDPSLNPVLYEKKK